MMALFWADLGIALLGTLLAALEVQIEGRYGWAERLPTWRPTGPTVRLVSRALGGKPVTGYHLVLLLFLAGVVHLPAAFVPWSPALEGWALSRFFFLTAFWDVQWFALNPHFTLRRLTPRYVWWHTRWLGDRLPLDYVYAVGLAAVCGAWWPEVWLGGLAVFSAETAAVLALGHLLVPMRTEPPPTERETVAPG